MDFKNAKELLALCQKKKLPISEVMRQREILLGETTAEIVDQRMDRVLEIMKDAAFSPIKDPVISMGGLIGGEARKLCEFHDLGKSLCGNVLGKGITYAMATLETNASMGLIVASPTAGSAGIVPGMMLALQEVYGFSDKKIRQALFNAGAIGYLAMRNAGRNRFCNGCFCCCGASWRYTSSVYLCCFHGSYEHAWTCVRPCRRPGGISLPEP